MCLLTVAWPNFKVWKQPYSQKKCLKEYKQICYHLTSCSLPYCKQNSGKLRPRMEKWNLNLNRHNSTLNSSVLTAFLCSESIWIKDGRKRFSSIKQIRFSRQCWRYKAMTQCGKCDIKYFNLYIMLLYIWLSFVSQYGFLQSEVKRLLAEFCAVCAVDLSVQICFKCGKVKGEMLRHWMKIVEFLSQRLTFRGGDASRSD